MAIPASPAVPNRNRPTAFSAEMDAFLAWFSSIIPELNLIATGSEVSGTFNTIVINSYITGSARRYLGGVVQSVGGTVNAITLTMGATATLLTGQHVRFVPTGANTGATTINLDGSGVKNCVTVTGAVLPAGYIRAGMPCDAVYDGTNWVVRRAPEYASNANGEYWRYEDGRQECLCTKTSTDTQNVAIGSLFRTAGATLTYPAAFVAAPMVLPGHTADTAAWYALDAPTTTAVFVRQVGATSGATNVTYRAKAEGRWY